MTCSSYQFSSLALVSSSLRTGLCKAFMHGKEDGNAALSLRAAHPKDISRTWVSWQGVSPLWVQNPSQGAAGLPGLMGIT